MALPFRCCVFARKLFNHVPKVQIHPTGVRGNHTDARVARLMALKNRKKTFGSDKLQHRNSFLDWNYRAELFAFANRIGEKFSEGVLERALTQRSHVIFEEERQKELGISDPKGLLMDNQDLAENGGCLMREVVQCYLRTALPKFPEEGILALCDHLLSEENLARIVSSIGAEELILCTDFPVEKKTLSSTLCSLVGAVEESNGQERAALFIRDFVISTLSGQEINAIWVPENPFNVLCEILARDGRKVPEPRIIFQTGINTILSCYNIGLYCDKKCIGSGSGESIEVAKEQASLDALWRLWGTKDGKLQFPFRIDVSTVQLKSNVSNISLSDWCSEKAKIESPQAARIE